MLQFRQWRMGGDQNHHDGTCGRLRRRCGRRESGEGAVLQPSRPSSPSEEERGLFNCLLTVQISVDGVQPATTASLKATKSSPMVVLTTNHPTQSNRTLHDAGARRGEARGRPRWKRGPFALPKLVGGPHLSHSAEAPPRCPTRLRQPDHPSCRPRTGGGHARPSATGTPRNVRNPQLSPEFRISRFLAWFFLVTKSSPRVPCLALLAGDAVLARPTITGGCCASL